MKDLREVISSPIQDKVIVEYLGVRYIADEISIRDLQCKVMDGIISNKDFTVYDTDKDGEEYEIIFREDGFIKNNFTCNIFNLVPDYAFKLFIDNKDKKKL